LLNLGVLFYLGVFQIGLAYLFVTRAIRHVPAFEATTVLLLEPALNPVWVWLVQRERPAASSIAGGVLILSATLANAWWQNRRRYRFAGHVSPASGPEKYISFPIKRLARNAAITANGFDDFSVLSFFGRLFWIYRSLRLVKCAAHARYSDPLVRRAAKGTHFNSIATLRRIRVPDFPGSEEALRIRQQETPVKSKLGNGILGTGAYGCGHRLRLRLAAYAGIVDAGL
jgi:hypothetical protein